MHTATRRTTPRPPCGAPGPPTTNGSSASCSTQKARCCPCSAQKGLFHLGLAWLRPGDAAIVPDPGYVTYSRGAQAAGADVFRLPLRPTNGYLPDFDVIPADTLRRARLLWLNYPHNPTGATAPLDIFVRAVDFARRHDLLLCHDAAYTRVTFDGYRAPSVLQAPGAKEVAVEFNSLSKSHNMAGWRVGVLVGNRDVVTALHRYKTNADSGHFLPMLESAAAALEATPAAWIEARNRAYAARREVVLHTLKSLGLSALHPKGGMYVWSPIPQGWDSAEKFALDLLEQA
ncbi:MAG: aminotransferase class I/II-fold pyridoxal phosphate-dependent enzyme, partial [Chloroflexi bacterium]|nr:aminotransferase class I/II-fold pyridoxal phosphate-dependent enzyme [Chloroflexota bacterium]